MSSRFLIAFSAALLIGCGTVTPPPDLLTGPEKRACLKAGGAYERRGWSGSEVCVKRFSDAGKACADGDACEGGCIFTFDGTDLDWREPRRGVVGQCQADNALFGCFGFVEDGVVERAACRD